MDSLVQLVAAVVSMTASFALVFGGIASWFLRRLDRRFDATERQAREDKADMHRQFDGVQRQFEEQRTDVQRQFDGVQRQFDALREEQGRLATRIDAVADQLSDARQSLGRLEGVMLHSREPEALAAPQRS